MKSSAAVFLQALSRILKQIHAVVVSHICVIILLCKKMVLTRIAAVKVVVDFGPNTRDMLHKAPNAGVKPPCGGAADTCKRSA